MRLPKVHACHSLREKLILTMIRMVTKRTVPGVVRTLFYRRDFFGGVMSPLTHEVMRGPSEWSVGERELCAAFVSNLNQCLF